MPRQLNRDPNKWVVFSLVGIGVFMSTLDGSIVNIALPAIMKDLQVPLATVGWVMMIYLLTVSTLLLSFGRLSDIRGRRWVYCRGFFIFSLGSLLCGISSNAAWLIASRSFQGIGASMIMACSPALVVDIFPASERGKALGMVGTVVAAGLSVGPALGGLLLQHFSWQPFRLPCSEVARWQASARRFHSCGVLRKIGLRNHDGGIFPDLLINVFSMP